MFPTSLTAEVSEGARLSLMDGNGFFFFSRIFCIAANVCKKAGGREGERETVCVRVCTCMRAACVRAE